MYIEKGFVECNWVISFVDVKFQVVETMKEFSFQFIFFNPQYMKKQFIQINLRKVIKNGNLLLNVFEVIFLLNNINLVL